jgi:hypothetical protein
VFLFGCFETINGGQIIMGLLSNIFSEFGNIINDELHSSGIVDEFKGEIRKGVHDVLQAARQTKDIKVNQLENKSEHNEKFHQFLKLARQTIEIMAEDHHDEIVPYLDYLWIVNIPEKQKANISQALNIPNNEQILFVFDSTFSGSATEGLAVTTRSIRYKTSLDNWELPLMENYVVQVFSDCISIRDGYSVYNVNKGIIFDSINQRLLGILPGLINEAQVTLGKKENDSGEENDSGDAKKWAIGFIKKHFETRQISGNFLQFVYTFKKKHTVSFEMAFEKIFSDDIITIDGKIYNVNLINLETYIQIITITPKIGSFIIKDDYIRIRNSFRLKDVDSHLLEFCIILFSDFISTIHKKFSF